MPLPREAIKPGRRYRLEAGEVVTVLRISRPTGWGRPSAWVAFARDGGRPTQEITLDTFAKQAAEDLGPAT
jgi:hypothetical protein